MEDANALLKCYSDENAVKFMNADSCTSNFSYQTIDEMEACIKLWLESYKTKGFVRFTVIDKIKELPVGTIEIFGGENGVMRLDICSEYENEDFI